MQAIGFENYIGIKPGARELLESWLRVAEADNAGHDVEFAVRRHAEHVCGISGEDLDAVIARTLRALERNRVERDSEKVLRRLRVATRRAGQ